MNPGSCLCGAVRFEAGQFDSMLHCHCSMCRRHHGAMFATFLGGKADAFRWIAGEDQVVTYQSSPNGLRPFCRTCGSVLPVVLPHLGMSFVPAGNLEGDPGMRPQLHMFAASGAAWFPITDALPQSEKFPPGFEDGVWIESPALPPAKPETVRGRCLCGDVAFELAGLPEFVQNCHCSRCRRARSAAHATNAFFKREQLTLDPWRGAGRKLCLAGRQALRPGILSALRQRGAARRRLHRLRRRALRWARRSARQAPAQPHLHGQQGAVVRGHGRAAALG